MPLISHRIRWGAWGLFASALDGLEGQCVACLDSTVRGRVRRCGGRVSLDQHGLFALTLALRCRRILGRALAQGGFVVGVVAADGIEHGAVLLSAATSLDVVAIITVLLVAAVAVVATIIAVALAASFGGKCIVVAATDSLGLLLLQLAGSRSEHLALLLAAAASHGRCDSGS